MRRQAMMMAGLLFLHVAASGGTSSPSEATVVSLSNVFISDVSFIANASCSRRFPDLSDDLAQASAVWSRSNRVQLELISSLREKLEAGLAESAARIGIDAKTYYELKAYSIQSFTFDLASRNDADGRELCIHTKNRMLRSEEFNSAFTAAINAAHAVLGE